jgi:RimJ/RimL family protein N-acetyltransferase
MPPPLLTPAAGNAVSGMHSEETGQGREIVKPYWEGKLVRLRGLEPADARHHFDMDQERNIDRNLDAINPPGSFARAEKWVGETSVLGFRDGENFLFEIEAMDSGLLVGSIDTHHCDPRVGKFSYGISIREQFRGRGYASDAILLVMRYYFLERRYQKCDVGAFSFNDASIRLHERLGFQLEGRQRRHTYTGGQFHDMLLFGMTIEEFQERHSEYLTM